MNGSNQNKHLDAIGGYIKQFMEKSEPDAPVWNIEKIRDGKPPAWNYIDGCMLTAVMNLYFQTKDVKYLEFADKFADFYISCDGHILGYKPSEYNLDNVCGGRVLFDLYTLTGKNKYMAAAETLYAQLLSQPRTKEGNFWHKRIYPYQVWLDGLYMAQVFYTRYNTKFNMGYTDITAQFINVRRLMYDETKKLNYHGYDESRAAFWCGKESGLSKSFWLRSAGWYLMALIDVIGYLPESASKEKAVLSAILKESAQGLLSYRDEKTGMFFQVIDKAGAEGNYPESSGSAMAAYAFMKGARLNVLDESFKKVGRGIFFSVCDNYLTEKYGALSLGGICLSAGLGPETNRKRDGSYEYYISEPVVENDAKGTAPLLLAYTEAII